MKNVLFKLTLPALCLFSLSAQADPVNFPQSGTWVGTYSIQNTTSNSHACDGMAGNDPVATFLQTSASGNLTFSGTLTLKGFSNQGNGYPDYANGVNIDGSIAPYLTYPPSSYPVWLGSSLSSNTGYNDDKITISVVAPYQICRLYVSNLTYQR